MTTILGLGFIWQFASGCESPILTWQTAQLRSRNTPHGSRPVVTLLEVLRRESSEMGLPIHFIHTYVQFVFMYVLACVSLCTYQTTWYGLWQTNFIEMFCSLLTYFQYRENSKVNKRTTRGKCAHSAAAAGCCCSCCGCTRSLATCVQFV